MQDHQICPEFEALEILDASKKWVGCPVGGWLGEAGHPCVAAQQFGLCTEHRGGAESLSGGH